MTFIKALRSVLPEGALQTKVPMDKYTSFKVGGAADVLAKPSTTEELTQLYKLCQENNWEVTLLGEGSNVLIADEGIRGVTILTTGLNQITVEAKPGELGYITAGAGARLSKVADAACKNGLQGMETLQAIPGSVGGAVYMNAGAFEHDIAEVCLSVTILRNNKFVTFKGTDMEFGYRASRVQREGGIIVEAVFRLLPGDAEEIRATMAKLNTRRREGQPHEPSAGSTFKRPVGYYAGKLIQDAGLKGFQVGGAQVSEKHAGFVINKGNATANDICNLMNEVRNRVHENAGVWLEPEVEILGRKYPWE